MEQTETLEVQIWQDGQCVASACCQDFGRARADGAHYVMMYAQDGPTEVREAVRPARPPSP